MHKYMEPSVLKRCCAGKKPHWESYRRIWVLFRTEGADGAPIDAMKVKSIYERAIRGGGHVGAMVCLRILRVESAEGVAE